MEAAEEKEQEAKRLKMEAQEQKKQERMSAGCVAETRVYINAHRPFMPNRDQIPHGRYAAPAKPGPGQAPGM